MPARKRLECAYGLPLSPGARAQVQPTLRAPAAAGTITHDPGVASLQVDPDEENNFDPVETRVAQE